MRGDAPGRASRACRQPNVAAIYECDFVVMNVGEEQQAPFCLLTYERERKSAGEDRQRENFPDSSHESSCWRLFEEDFLQNDIRQPKHAGERREIVTTLDVPNRKS